MTAGAVLVAAGAGDRFGAELPKALVALGDRPLVCHAHDRLTAAGVTTIVVVAPPTHHDETVAVLGGTAPDRIVVPGGATRAQSVRAGLAALPSHVDLVAVHDAARALTPPDIIQAAIRAVVGDVVAAAPARPVTDTVKRVAGDVVVATVDRSDLVVIQTPQVFRRVVLEQAHRSGDDATDDLALVEALVARGDVSGRILVTPGAASALKITFPEDLAVAAALEAAP